MFKKIFLIIFPLFIAHAYALEITSSYQYASVAFREDSLRWKIETSVGNPTVASEVSFEGVKMLQWTLGSQATLNECYSLKSILDYAFAYNRPFDCAYDVNLALGYHLFACDRLLKITPYAGFSIERQSYRSGAEKYNSKNYFDEDPNYFGLLRTRYNTHWYGPWIGFDSEYQINECWVARGSFAYHFTFLKSTGKTRFGEFDRDGYTSTDRIRHKAHGYGFDLGLALRYNLSEEWAVDLNAELQTRKANHGKQKGKHIYDDGVPLGLNQHSFNELVKIRNKFDLVEWRSVKLEIALGYVF